MRKFWALLINECIKLTHRTLFIVGVVSLLLIPLLVFYRGSRPDSYDRYVDNEVIEGEETGVHEGEETGVLGEFRRSYENAVDNYGEDPAWDVYDWWERYEVLSAKYRLEEAEAIAATDPNRLNIVYITDVISSYGNNRAIQVIYQEMVDEADGDPEQLEEATWFMNDMARGQSIEQIEASQTTAKLALESGKLDDYIDYRFSSGDFSKGVGEITDNEVLYRSLWDKVDENQDLLYDDELFYTLEGTIDGYMRRVQSLQIGVDDRAYGNAPLTPHVEGIIKNEMNILMYQIEHTEFLMANTGVETSVRLTASTRSFNNSFSAMYLILTIGMMILSASTVSQEMETGTIKALIISPTKRYKIILAKFVSLIMVALGLALVTVLWILMLSQFFFGSGSLPGLLINAGNSVLAFRPFMAAMVRLAASLVQLIIFMIAGMTLSTVLRHTAIAVGLSIGIFFGNMIAQLILLVTPFTERVRLLPFFNIDFSGRIGASLADWIFGDMFYSHYPYLPFAYSAIYTAVLAFLLLWTCFDSFIRRDI